MTSLTYLLTATITAIFFLVVLSYYGLLFIERKKRVQEKKFKSITIIIPARNEEEHIAQCIRAVLTASFQGKKQIIIIDDASNDSTTTVVREAIQQTTHDASILLLQNKKHSGKSYCLNRGLKLANGELIAVVDADSIIAKNALAIMAQELGRKNVAGAACVVKTKNRGKFLNAWVHIDLIYGSFLRSLMAKINANVVTPGPLSMYRKSALLEIHGFSTQGFSEDMDVAVRLIRKGHHISFVEEAVSETNMPITIKSFFRQRMRMARGMIYFLKKHTQVNTKMIDIYTMPLFAFTYFQAVIMGLITLYQIVFGYWTYFVSQGVLMNWYVVRFFFEWFSIVGFVKWTFAVLSGTQPLTLASAAGISATVLTYPLFIMAIIKYDKKIDLLHIIPLCFMFPFWLLLMIIYTICIPEILFSKQYNKWKKNE